MPHREVPFPLFPELREPHPLCYVSFFSCLSVIQFFFFLGGWGSVFPGGYADLSQGWLWEYHVPLIFSPVDLCLPSRLGASAWQPRSPSVFSVYCGMGKLCVGWMCRGVRVLPLLGGFSCEVCLQHLSKTFTLRNTHYLLPPSSCHLGTSPSLYIKNTFPSKSPNRCKGLCC
jgi:hypothetical protein